LKAHTNFPVEVNCSGGCRLQAYRNEEQCHIACDLGGTNIAAPFGEDEEKLQLTPQRRIRRSRGSESPLRAFCFVGVSVLFCRRLEGTWTVFGQSGLRERHKYREEEVTGTGENYGTGHFIHNIYKPSRFPVGTFVKKKRENLENIIIRYQGVPCG
jgi:hypothetical protein